MIFELCTDSLEGAKAAVKFGCKRIELCTALSVGGLTPNIGLVLQCVAFSELETHVMIRPREGDFVYSMDEILQMEIDIKQLASTGIKGVVFGVLNADDTIASVNGSLVSLAKSLKLEVTFHRAFDFVKNVDVAMQTLIDFGFDRLLSSGLEVTVDFGLPVLKKLQLTYGHQIQVMAGSGVNMDNMLIIARSGIGHVHFTARKLVSESTALEMGSKMKVDLAKINAIVTALL